MRKKIYLGVVGLCLFWIVGCSSIEEPVSLAMEVTETAELLPTVAQLAATPLPPPSTSTPKPTISTTASPTVTPSPTVSPTATATETPTITPTPEPVSYLANYRLVTYYGSPLGRGLGILGNSPRLEMLADLRRISREYEPFFEQEVLPTFHLISSVANLTPPEYRYQIELDVIEGWIELAEEEGVAVILDIQPGRADLMEEIERLKPYLYLPHVHLAIDPEWMMGPDEIPGDHIGSMTAEQINEVQAMLNEIALEMGMSRLLIIHQFKDSMIKNKELIKDFPYVEFVLDTDGAFNSAVKLIIYKQYAAEPGFEYGGIKLFTVRDDRLITPEELMQLNPVPVIIIYQ